MSTLRSLLAAGNNKGPNLVIHVVGNESYHDSISRALIGKFNRESEILNVSLESEQMGSDVVDNTPQRDGKMNVYVINPKQTGFSNTVAMTIDVLRNPEGTAVALIESTGDSMTEEERKDMIDAKAILEQNGAKVFDTLDDMSAYVNSAMEVSDAKANGTPTEPVVDKGDASVDDDSTKTDAEKAGAADGGTDDAADDATKGEGDAAKDAGKPAEDDTAADDKPDDFDFDKKDE